MEHFETSDDIGGPVEELRREGYLVLPSRKNAAPVIAMLGTEELPTVLEPKAAVAEGAWSHSDHYGFGYFPWHTDGAVALLPPRWLVMECEALEGPSSTELLEPTPELMQRLRRCAMRVRTRTGRIRYVPPLSPTTNGEYRLRWDPRVCEVNDVELSTLVEAEPPTAICEWVEGRVLLMDNWRLLHRRPAVNPSALRRLTRSYVRTA